MDFNNLASYWNNKFLEDGHTGYHDQLIHNYDQPLRIKKIEKVLQRLLPSGLKGRNILDIGCGTGDFIALSLEQGADKVCGVDISPKVIEMARNRFKAYGYRVSLEAKSLQNIELPKNTFDLITSVTVLQHIVDNDEVVGVLRKLSKSLKDGGYMVLLEISPINKVEQVNPNILKERTFDEWRNIFSNAELSFVYKPLVYAPLGFCILQLWLPTFIQKYTSKNKTKIIGNNKVSCISKDGLKQRIFKKLYRLLKVAILIFTYPIDHLFTLSKVPAQFAYYHIFILRRETQ